MWSSLLTLFTYLVFTYCHELVYGQEEGVKGNDDRKSLPPVFDANAKAAEAEASVLSNNIIFGTIISSILFLQTATLLTMGQPLISKSGNIKLWEGGINSKENSQQISDWYTFTHMVHGVIFYCFGLFVTWLCPGIGGGVKVLYILALIIEALWEIVENSPAVINRYRSTALAAGYVGDSILNSVSDNVAMSIGFWLTHALPLGFVLILVVLEEIVLLVCIRDNLTLNVIQLVSPSERISKWQAAGNKEAESKEEKAQ